MLGNSQVRFLGGLEAVRLPAYPVIFLVRMERPMPMEMSKNVVTAK